MKKLNESFDECKERMKDKGYSRQAAIMICGQVKDVRREFKKSKE